MKGRRAPGELPDIETVEEKPHAIVAADRRQRRTEVITFRLSADDAAWLREQGKDEHNVGASTLARLIVEKYIRDRRAEVERKAESFAAQGRGRRG